MNLSQHSLVILAALLAVGPTLAQPSDSGDMFIRSPNPFASNIENQGVSPEFTVQGEQPGGERAIGGSESGGFGDGGDGSGSGLNAPINPFAAPNFDPNADALFNSNAESNLSVEDNFARQMQEGPAFLQQPTQQPPRGDNGNSAQSNNRPNPADEQLDEDIMLTGGMTLAKERVLKYPCVSGGTIERCMQLKALMPDFGDKGWEVRSDGLTERGDNQYVVQRVLLLSGTLPIIYSWRVDARGQVEPITIRAEMITETDL